MSLELSWVGEESFDRVARTRFRCYSPSEAMWPKFDNATRLDGRQTPGDFLLATRDGQDVGTATSLSLAMWMRGSRVPTQGIAWVGTIKTARRGGTGESRGVASLVMDAMLGRAREREEWATALMPFRASFYEHFGFGNAEGRVEWTIPLALLSRGHFDGYRFYEAADDVKILALRDVEARLGQCDVETTPAAWENWKRDWPGGLNFVDQPVRGGPIEGFVRIVEDRGPQVATAAIEDWALSSPARLPRLLHFLGSLKDQYTFARIQLPSDWPINRLIRESQLPHRQVDHPHAAARAITRLQIRVLDHKRLIESLTLPSSVRGKVNVSVGECEGTISRLAIELDAGRLAVKPASGSPDVEVPDRVWASIVAGDLRASGARQIGLLPSTTSDAALNVLDAFASGPAPFCQEYF